MAPVRRVAYPHGMIGNIIHVVEGQEPPSRAWVAVRRIADQFRVTVNDPRNPNPVTLSERFDSFWTALLSARARAKSLGVPVHAVGCRDS
jgi:hypothetical protein